jgi:hypothetical protein
LFGRSWIGFREEPQHTILTGSEDKMGAHKNVEKLSAGQETKRNRRDRRGTQSSRGAKKYDSGIDVDNMVEADQKPLDDSWSVLLRPFGDE